MSYLLNIPKIDELAVNGLAGVHDSLAYRVEEIEKHLHNTLQVYGNTANTMARGSTTEFIVVGGNNAFGTELQLHNGMVIESGSATKKFDMNTMYIISVSASNKPTFVEFYTAPKVSATACTFQDTGDTVTAAGHGLNNGDKVVFDSIVTTTGINIYTVYYVISSAPTTFQLSLTLGGSAVALTTNGSGTYQKLTQTLLTETIVSMSSTNSDAAPFTMISHRVACNSRVSIRAKSVSGSTISIGFFIGLHTYSA